MVLPSTANGFTAAVSTMRPLEGGKGVSFYSFTLPEDCCVRILVKNLVRGMPESVALDIHIQGVMQLLSGLRDQAKPRTALSPPFLCVIGANSAAYECRWSRTWLQKARCNANAASASYTRSVTADTRPGASRVVDSTSPVGAQPCGSASVL